MSNFVIVDATVLTNLWNASGGNTAVATQLFNTLLQPGQMLVITDTVKGEAAGDNNFPKDQFINNWINTNSSQIFQPTTGVPPDNGGELYVAMGQKLTLVSPRH